MLWLWLLYGYTLGPSPVPPICLCSGSFGLVGVPRGYNTARLSRVRPSIKRKPDVRGATPFVYFVCVRCSRGHCYPLTGSQSGPWPRHFVCIYPINLGIVTPLRNGDGFKVVCVGWKSKKARFSPGAPHPKKGRCSPEKQESKIFAGQAPPPKGPRLSRNRTQKAQESKIFSGRLSAAFQR